MIKPFKRHSKGLSALTALIGSLMSLPTIYLTHSKSRHPVCTHQIYGRLKFQRNGFQRVSLAEFMFNKSLDVDHIKCVTYLLYNTVNSGKLSFKMAISCGLGRCTRAFERRFASASADTMLKLQELWGLVTGGVFWDIKSIICQQKRSEEVLQAHTWQLNENIKC